MTTLSRRDNFYCAKMEGRAIDPDITAIWTPRDRVAIVERISCISRIVWNNRAFSASAVTRIICVAGLINGVINLCN